MDIDQIINQIDSQITGGIRKKATIFDLGPKERFQMLKEVNKYKIRQANLNAGKPGKSYQAKNVKWGASSRSSSTPGGIRSKTTANTHPTL